MPIPTPAPGEVLVRVAAATVNPTDLLFRAGLQASAIHNLVPPYVPGMELAGVVHEIGDESTGVAVGQRVMGIVDPRREQGGAQAEYVLVPAASLAPVAQDDMTAAATVPMNGLTAVIAIEALEAAASEVVLITGGAGGVGGYAIQLAKLAGLEVVADAKDEDAALLSALGADHVVPRGPAMTEAVRSIRSQGVDHLIDAARLGPVAMSLVRDDGAAVALRTTDAGDDRLRCTSVLVGKRMTDTAALRRLALLADRGALTTRVALRLPMERAADAHRLVERGGLRGRVVLEFDGKG
jgi:NADPH:quinone reductase-like Zn-dependent oxidoreductase